MNRLLPLVLVSALVLTGTGPARAELIAINLGGATFTAVADTVTLTPRTFTLDLTPDVPLTALLQSGEFTVGDGTNLPQGDFPGTMSRPVTAGGATGTLSQPVRVAITSFVDTLSFFAGPKTLLDLGGLRKLEIATLGRTAASRNSLGTSPFDLQGTFRLTVVPEPSTLVLSGLGVLGLLGNRCRRRS